MLNTLELTRLIQPPGTGKKARVLVVDDDASLRDGFAVCLSLYSGIECIGMLRNGAEAVYYAGRLTPDVILMDTDMPQLDGYRTTEYIRRQYPESRIILLIDGPVTALHRQRAEKIGASACVSKDEHVDRLARLILSAANQS